jgi:GNAT superfamily N-acetyltransferase
VRVQVADAFLAPRLQGYTFPAFRARLAGLRPEQTLPLAALRDNVPIGLALVEIARPVSRLLSIYVDPTNRGQGIAKLLLLETADHLRALGVAQLHATYAADGVSAPALERAFRATGWSAPQRRMLIGRGNRRILEAPIWRRARIPAGYTITRLTEYVPPAASPSARPEHRQSLQAALTETPDAWENSMMLQHDGEAAGWLLTHRLDTETIRYSQLYIAPEHRAFGCSLALMHRALLFQADLLGLDSFGTVGVRLASGPMAHFIMRSIKPYLANLHETRGVTLFIQTEKDVSDGRIPSEASLNAE